VGVHRTVLAEAGSTTVRTVRWTASVAVLALVSACAAGPTDGDTTDGDAADGAAAGSSAATGPEADAGAADAPGADAPGDTSGSDTVAEHDLLAFTGRLLDGGDFDGAVVTGDVLVWFWAPW
jgi:hypothetical protein